MVCGSTNASALLQGCGVVEPASCEGAAAALSIPTVESQESEGFNPMQAILVASGLVKACRTIGLRRIGPQHIPEQ